MQERMQKNLAFFSKHKIAESLHLALSGGNRKFGLFFNQSEINIIDLQSKTFLYPKNSFLQITQNIATNPLNNDKWSIYANHLKLVKLDENRLKITAKAINSIVDSTQTPESHTKQNNSQSPNAHSYHLPHRFLPQTNIFGLCGGLFLDILLDNGFTFHSLLIYEEEAELFALSCYFVDYAKLFSQTSPKSCYIFIENLLNKAFLNHYFYSKKITNNFLRLELNMIKSQKTQSFRALVNETYKANARGWGSFEDEIVGLKNTLKNAESTPFLKINKKLKIPICVVGSGPSLESNIDFIKQNQNKMLIFSCGTALKVLKKHNVNIDFQIEIERVPYLNKVLESSNLGDTTLLCASLIDNKALNIAKNALLFMRGGSAAGYIFSDIMPVEFCAPFVGNAGFALALHLSDEIILCGMDCGYIKGFTKHSKGSFYGDESSVIPNDCFQVAGNTDIEVYSNAIFSLSKETFSLAIKHYKPKIVHNLSLGARIQGTIFTTHLTLKNNANKAKIKKSLEHFYINDFTNAKKQLYDIDFIKELKNRINCDVSSKQELFCFVDSISEFLAKTAFNNPAVGILLEGSISHLLQNMLIALLKIKKNAIGTEFNTYKNIILEAIVAFENAIKMLLRNS